MITVSMFLTAVDDSPLLEYGRFSLFNRPGVCLMLQSISFNLVLLLSHPLPSFYLCNNSSIACTWIGLHYSAICQTQNALTVSNLLRLRYRH